MAKTAKPDTRAKKKKISVATKINLCHLDTRDAHATCTICKVNKYIGLYESRSLILCQIACLDQIVLNPTKLSPLRHGLQYR